MIRSSHMRLAATENRVFLLNDADARLLRETNMGTSVQQSMEAGSGRGRQNPWCKSSAIAWAETSNQSALKSV